MKLWLDDIRACPDGWALAKSVNEAKSLMKEFKEVLEFASLDHDLGDYSFDGGDGWRLTRWLLEEWIDGVNYFPSRGIRVHSANTVGVSHMLSDIDYANPYGDSEFKRRSFQVFRGESPDNGWPTAKT